MTIARSWGAGLLVVAAAVGLGRSAEPPVPTSASRWRGRTFEQPAAAVRQATLIAMANAQLELDGDAPRDAQGELVTAYREFGKTDFGPDVSVDPPDLSRMFPFILKRKLSQGEYRLRARIDPREDGGTQVDLLVEFLVPAINRITYEDAKVERASNGVIEGYFHDRIEIALLPPASPSAVPPPPD